MRHLIIEEPYSRPAKWSPVVAWFGLIVAVMSALLIRWRLIDYNAGFIALGSGIAIAALAILLSLIGFVRIWQEGRRGLGSAINGILLAFLVIAYPALMGLKAVTLPPIKDVSTDTENPPSFSRSRVALEARGGHVPPDATPQEREEQRQAYVQIAPLALDVGPEEAFLLVQKLAGQLGWTIIEEVRPGGRTGAGRIEAIDHTFVLNLPDDITIRIRPRAEGSRIDIRSASRIGHHDLGGNAARIRKFIDGMSELTSVSG